MQQFISYTGWMYFALENNIGQCRTLHVNGLWTERYTLWNVATMYFVKTIFLAKCKPSSAGLCTETWCSQSAFTGWTRSFKCVYKTNLYLRLLQIAIHGCIIAIIHDCLLCLLHSSLLLQTLLGLLDNGGVKGNVLCKNSTKLTKRRHRR